MQKDIPFTATFVLRDFAKKLSQELKKAGTSLKGRQLLDLLVQVVGWGSFNEAINKSKQSSDFTIDEYYLLYRATIANQLASECGIAVDDADKALNLARFSSFVKINIWTQKPYLAKHISNLAEYTTLHNEIQQYKGRGGDEIDFYKGREPS